MTCQRAQQARVRTKRDAVSCLTAQGPDLEPTVVSGGGGRGILALQRKLDPQSGHVVRQFVQLGKEDSSAFGEFLIQYVGEADKRGKK